ncbi:MAG: FAD-dependent oxidoreductase [Nitrososphaeria archaeon]
MRSLATDKAVIIGSGITGALIALNLALAGLKVALVEKDAVPGGSSVRIAGVLHSGARFAGSDDALASECYKEWKWWNSVLSEDRKKVGGYFIGLKEDAKYHDIWLDSVKKVGIPHAEVSTVDFGELIRREAVERAYWVPEIRINAAAVLNDIINRAVNAGAELYFSHQIVSAVQNEHEYIITLEKGDSKNVLRGIPVIAAGLGIPEVSEKFGIQVDAKRYQGSHLLVNGRTRELLEIIHRPGLYDLFIPAEYGTYITPTLTDFNRFIVKEEEISGLYEKMGGILQAGHSVIGSITAGRIAIESPKSTIGWDYVAYQKGVIIAWSSNYACARRVAKQVADLLGSRFLLDVTLEL